MNYIQNIRAISRNYRLANRLRQIISILVKNGFGYLFENLLDNGISRRLLFWRHRGASRKSLSDIGLERLLTTICELGATFVKFGQMLSCRPDLLPDRLIQVLSKLRAEVPPFSFADACKVIEEELGQGVEGVFSEISEETSGSASLSQGYRAVLKDGRRVFVKVQRPGVVPKVKSDLEILGILAASLEKSLPEASAIGLAKLVEDFSEGFLDELDFLNEASNMRAFRRKFAEEESLVVPEPITEYCTKRVLTMTYIDGISFNEPEKIRESGMDNVAVAKLGVELLLKQLFEAGLFHGDPHPGNMFCLRGPKIAYVDFGVMGRLTLRDRVALKKITVAMFVGDMQTMASQTLDLAVNPEQVDSEGLERDLGCLVATHLQGSVDELNVVQLVLDFHKICLRRKLCLKPHFGRMVRALGYADAIGRSIAPQFRIMEVLRPFFVHQTIEQFNPTKKLTGFWHCLNDCTELLEHAPANVAMLFKRLQRGKISIQIQQPDVHFQAQKNEQSTRFLAKAIVVSALFITSALMAGFRIPPMVQDVSMSAAVTFGIAVIMTIKIFFFK